MNLWGNKTGWWTFSYPAFLHSSYSWINENLKLYCRKFYHQDGIFPWNTQPGCEAHRESIKKAGLERCKSPVTKQAEKCVCAGSVHTPTPIDTHTCRFLAQSFSWRFFSRVSPSACFIGERTSMPQWIKLIRSKGSKMEACRIRSLYADD